MPAHSPHSDHHTHPHDDVAHDPGHAHHAGHRHGPDHSHDHSKASARTLAIALALTGTFMLVEFAGGLLAGSLALIADAGHMLTDTAALALAWAAVHLAARPADLRRTFGYQRLRVIATFVNGCALVFLTAWVAIEAVQRFMHPLPVDGSTILKIGTAGLIINLIVFALLRRADEHDMNISAATLHVLSDLLGSVAAIVAALVILYTGWTPIDPLLSLFVCLLILRSAWALIRRSTHILMEGSPEELDVADLRRTLEQRIPAIRDVHHVHTWLVGPHDILLTMHASVIFNADHSNVLREAKTVLAERYGIKHATIQIESDECVDEDCAGP
ncbi:MAG: cation diffusion facilitator family transporter [Povalibacter sp.]